MVKANMKMRMIRMVGMMMVLFADNAGTRKEDVVPICIPVNFLKVGEPD